MNYSNRINTHSLRHMGTIWNVFQCGIYEYSCVLGPSVDTVHVSRKEVPDCRLVGVLVGKCLPHMDEDLSLAS